jgi:putative PEP-CTERM system TPR-repeat lipoprotein
MLKAMAFLWILLFSIISSFAFADPAENYEKAFQSYHEEDYDAAYIHLKNVLQEDPEHLPGKILLGKLYLDNELYEQAALEFQEALFSGADLNLILKPMTVALLRSREYQDVLDLVKGHKFNEQSQFENYLARADAFIGLERMNEAMVELQKAIELLPQDIRGLNALISLHLRNDKRKEAREVIQRAHDLSDQDGTAWFLLGQLEKREGNQLGALNAFQQALVLKPSDNRIQRALASINLQLGDLSSAEVMINTALSLRPGDPLAILVKSRLLQLNNDTEQATTILSEMNQKLSLATNEYLSRNHWVYFIRGLSSYIIGHYENTVNDLTTYIQEKPRDYNAVNLLVETYIHLGENNLATSLLERYYKLVGRSLELKFSLQLCDLYIASRRHFRCTNIIDNLDKKFPGDGQVLITKARSMVGQGRYKEAVEFTKQAYARDKDRVIGHYLAKLFLVTNQFQDALVFTDHLLSLEPDNVELLNIKGETFLKLNNLEEASEVLVAAIAIDQYYFPSIMNLANIDILKGEYAKAKKSLEFIIASNPPHAGASSLLSEAEARLGNISGSIQVLKDYRARRPEDSEVKKLLVQLLSRSGQPEQALALLETGSDIDRFDDEYLKAKAELLLKLRDPEGAQEQHRLLYTIWQKEPAKLLTLSRMQKQAGGIGAALRSVETALKTAPESNALLIERIKLETLGRSLVKAEQHLISLKAKSPEWSEVWNVEGDLRLAQKKTKEAQASYAKAFELSGSANGLILLKLYNLAVDGYESNIFERQVIQALELNGNNHYFRNLYADYMLLNERFAEARESYLPLTNVSDFPNQASLYNNLALATAQIDIDEALRYAERASKLKPNSANIMDTYGWLLAKTQQYSEALRVLRVAYSIKSVDPNILYHLGYVLNQLGRKNEAITQLQAALTSTEAFKDNERAYELLTSLTNK